MAFHQFSGRHAVKMSDIEGLEQSLEERKLIARATGILQDLYKITEEAAYERLRAYSDEVRAEGTPEEIVPARVFTGNRPTTSIFGVALTPFALGELIALYEHITFVEGTVWGLDSYDQWGVELGKQLAKQITPAISKDDDALAAQDPSTQSLIKFYRANREF